MCIVHKRLMYSLGFVSDWPRGIVGKFLESRHQWTEMSSLKVDILDGVRILVQFDVIFPFNYLWLYRKLKESVICQADDREFKR